MPNAPLLQNNFVVTPGETVGVIVAWVSVWSRRWVKFENHWQKGVRPWGEGKSRCDGHGRCHGDRDGQRLRNHGRSPSGVVGSVKVNGIGLLRGASNPVTARPKPPDSSPRS